MTTNTRFDLFRSTPSLWRVTFNNPPINLIDAVMMKELLNLLTEIERDKRVGVVLFDSADPDFLLAHYDLAGDPAELESIETTEGRHPFTDLHIRLSKSPAVTISAIRGRARGAGGEFALATDIRFASRERAGTCANAEWHDHCLKMNSYANELSATTCDDCGTEL
jgi:enoyl-CoA hydratase/carnithine racemase